MYPVLFKFGSITVLSFDVVVIISFLTTYFFSIFNAKKKGINIDEILNISIIIIFSTIIGSRLLYIIAHHNEFKGNFLGIFNMIKYKGSMGLGGIILTAINIFIYCKIKKISFFKITDIIMPYFILGAAIFRLGCFLNGCCFGKPTNLPWGIMFSQNSPAGIIFPSIKIHPTQFYYIILYLIIFLFLLYIERKKIFDGLITPITLILFGFTRFLVDFFRYYEEDQYFNLLFLKLTVNQLISIFIILGSIIIFIILKKTKLIPNNI